MALCACLPDDIAKKIKHSAEVFNGQPLVDSMKSLAINQRGKINNAIADGSVIS